VTGSLVWGVYTYRLHNLPLFIPPAHGLVYLSGLALAQTLRAHARALVAFAAAALAPRVRAVVFSMFRRAEPSVAA
jgi:hypothetical protein